MIQRKRLSASLISGAVPVLICKGLKGRSWIFIFGIWKIRRFWNKGLSYNPHEYGVFNKVKFLDDAKNALFPSEDSCEEKPFNVIICSATLHELFKQSPFWELDDGSGSDTETRFANWFFHQIVTLDWLALDPWL